MVLRSKYPILFGLAFGVLAGSYVWISFKNQELAIVLGLVCFLLGTTISYFRLSTAATPKAEEPSRQSLKNCKEVIYKGGANHFFENTTAGGTLYLMRDKLIFQTNFLKSKLKHETIILLNDIKEVSFAKTHRIADKVIVIVTKLGEERFLVTGNQLWIDEIENAMMQNAMRSREGKTI